MSLLGKLAAQAPAKESQSRPIVNGQSTAGNSFAWLDALLARNSGKLPAASEWESYEGGRRKVFEVCPFNPEHRNGSAFIIQRAEGTIQAGCHHNGCAKENWRTLRAMIEPQAQRPAPSRNGSRGENENAPGGAEKHNAPSPILTCLADVEAREISWLWPGRVPLGRITLLVGRPGEGKSFLTIDMTARVTTGTPWPDGSECPAGSVILISAEDDAGDTIRPRLDAAGADVRKVHLLSGIEWTGDGGERKEVVFTLANIAALEDAIKSIRPALCIIDPIGSYLGGDTDAHRDNEVRGVLAPVGKLAERYGVAMLIVAHRRKSAGSSADDLALGSRAFTGIARATWHLSRDPENKARRLLLPGKNNLAREGDGLAFTIDGHPPKLFWEADPVTMSADEGLAAESIDREKPGPEPKARHAAEEWLAGLLADESVFVGDPKRPEDGTIRAEAIAAGFSWATVRRAADVLGVQNRKCQFTKRYQWLLKLPEQPAPKKNNLSNLSNHVKTPEENNNSSRASREVVKLFSVGGNLASSDDLSMRTPNAGGAV